MKEYIFKEKIRRVNSSNERHNAIIPDKEIHNVIIPNKHSTIDALILETKDLNAWDDWANITNYHTLCMVLKKGKKEWETLYNGSTRTFKINGVFVGSVGIFKVLFQLETEKVKNSFLKKEEIKELKDRIKKDTQRLQILKNS